jgi:hypothetical protein
MLYKWEHVDIKAGRRIESHNRSEPMIIGYHPNPGEEHFTRGETWCVVSLHDGQLTESFLTKPQLVEWLNNSGARPVDIREGDVS